MLSSASKKVHLKYENALIRLYNMNRAQKYKYNLDNVKKISSLFGNPHKGVDFIHITGTNGKGSVTYKTAQILQDNKMKVGMFTSPHLTTFRERI